MGAIATQHHKAYNAFTINWLGAKMFRKYFEEATDDGAASGGAVVDAKTYTAEDFEAATKGMKAKLDELLGEKKAAAAKAKEAEAARLAAEQDAARKSGELDKFEATLRDQFSKEKEPLVAKLTALESRVLGAERKAILGSFAAEFIAPESVDLVAQLVKTGLDGDSIKTQFVDFAGEVITTDPREFKKWMQKHPALSHLMVSDAASGGGAAGSKGAGGVKTFAQMSLTERAQLANSDPAQYARLSKQQ